MASKLSDDEAIKARTIAHLNKSHQDSLVMYLEHYQHQSSFSARNARLTALDHSGLTISAAGGTHVVPFPSGPLASLSEVRPAVVAMDQACRQALGRSATTVTTFVPPTGVGAAFALFAFHNLVTMWDPAAFYLPGAWAYEHVYGWAPWYARLSYANAWWVWWLIVGGHGIELLTIFLPKLRRHNVPVGSGLWWKWVASQFLFDGIATIWRLDGLVKEKEAEKERASH